MPDKLQLTCPDCGRKVPPCDFFYCATVIIRRRCKCSQNWAIKIRPVQAHPLGAYVHELTWTRR
jgi:hypothetical protein